MLKPCGNQIELFGEDDAERMENCCGRREWDSKGGLYGSEIMGNDVEGEVGQDLAVKKLRK